MKEIRGLTSRLHYVFDRFQQPFAVDRFRKHLCFRDLELLFRGRICREQKRLQSRKNFTERATERETIYRGPLELRQQKSALVVLPRPMVCGCVAFNKVALVRGVLLHHAHQLLPDLSVVVDNEQLHHCDGAVKGGGKRLRSFVGSARTACN